MRVLLISSIYPSESNPALGIYVQRIHDIYLELGYQVKLITYKSGNNIVKKLHNLLKFWKKIKKELKTNSFDIINVQYPFLAAIPFRKLSPKKPLVTTLHGTDVKHNNFLRNALDKYTATLLKKSDIIAVNSRFFQEYVESKYEISEGKVTICPAGGFDERIFNPERETKYPIADNKSLKWIGYAGRIVDKKGWRVVLKAYTNLIQSNQFNFDLGLKIAGDGSGYRSLLSEVEQIRSSVDNVKIETLGNLKEEELGEFYRSLDLFIFPTMFEESLGLVAIESLACGTPVVASDLGAISEYLSENKNGFLFSAGDVNGLNDKIIEYFSLSEPQRIEMSLASVKSVSIYSRNTIKICVQDLFVRLCDSDGSL